MKRYAFTICLLLYGVHFLLPLVQQRTGIELELLVWDALFSRRLAPEAATTAWALRWLMHTVLISLAWLRVPEVYTWVYTRVDGRFLHQLLGAITVFVLGYGLLQEGGRWDWGMWYWSAMAAASIAAHVWVPVPLLRARQHDLDAHFVPLEED